MADVEAAADIARVRRPAQMDDRDQVIDFIGPITGFSPEDRRLRVFVAFPASLLQSAAEPEALIEEFGFGIGEIETFTVLEALPAQFMVFSGVSPRNDLPEVAPGVLTVGDGEDLIQDFENVSAVRRLGRPWRVAERDGFVGISLETAPLVAWHDDSVQQTLADDPSLLAVAQRLDEVGVVSASLSTSDSFAGFEASGIAWTEDDDGPVGVVVLSYPSEAAAADRLGAVTAGFDEEPRSGAAVPSERMVVDSVELRGAEIVMVVHFLPETNPQILLDMWSRREGPFAP